MIYYPEERDNRQALTATMTALRDRGIVNTIPYHGRYQPSFLDLPYFLGFFVGEDFGEIIVQGEFLRHPSGYLSVAYGKHHAS